jgi:hypothetical protein
VFGRGPAPGTATAGGVRPGTVIKLDDELTIPAREHMPESTWVMERGGS